MTESRTIKHMMFPYWTEIPKPQDPSQSVRVRRFARKGETVSLLAGDIAKGEATGAFVTEADLAAEAAGADDEGTDITMMTVVELATFIESSKPTVKALLEAVGDDVELAERVLDAETAATGGKPRPTLVRGLTAIESTPEDEGDEDDDGDFDDDEDDE